MKANKQNEVAEYSPAQINPHMKGVRLPNQDRSNWLKEAVSTAFNNAHQPNKFEVMP